MSIADKKPLIARAASNQAIPITRPFAPHGDVMIIVTTHSSRARVSIHSRLWLNYVKQSQGRSSKKKKQINDSYDVCSEQRANSIFSPLLLILKMDSAHLGERNKFLTRRTSILNNPQLKQRVKSLQLSIQLAHRSSINPHKSSLAHHRHRRSK